MRKLEEILNEVKAECARDNCQSWQVICITAMERTLKEASDAETRRSDVCEEYKQELVTGIALVSMIVNHVDIPRLSILRDAERWLNRAKKLM